MVAITKTPQERAEDAASVLRTAFSDRSAAPEPVTTAPDPGLLNGESTPDVEPYSPPGDLAEPADLSDTPTFEPTVFDSQANIDAQVSDINTLTDLSNPLMQDATTKGLQHASSRGLLNSSMSAGAAETSRLGTVMPLVQQTAADRSQWNLTGYGAEIDDYLSRLDSTSRERLINVEQIGQRVIANDQNAADFFTDAVGGYIEVLNNPDIDGAGQEWAADELFGYTGDDGAYHPGLIDSTLDYMDLMSGGEGILNSDAPQITGGVTGDTQGVPQVFNPVGMNMSTTDIYTLATADMIANGDGEMNSSTGNYEPGTGRVYDHATSMGLMTDSFPKGRPSGSDIEISPRTLEIYNSIMDGGVNDMRGDHWSVTYDRGHTG